jgi:hypothetical protein
MRAAAPCSFVMDRPAGSASLSPMRSTQGF